MPATATATAAAPRRREQAAPPLRLVAPPRRTGRYALLTAGVALAGVFGLVWLNALVAEHAFAARALESEVSQLTLAYDELTADVAALESPARIAAAATEELGMVPAGPPGYLVLQRSVPPSQADAAPAAVVDAVKPTLHAGR